MPAPVRQASPTSNPTEPPDHGPTITFMRSSQARHWRYSAEQIRTMRLQSNEAACLRLRKIWEKERVSGTGMRPSHQADKSKFRSSRLCQSKMSQNRHLHRKQSLLQQSTKSKLLFDTTSLVYINSSKHSACRNQWKQRPSHTSSAFTCATPAWIITQRMSC